MRKNMVAALIKDRKVLKSNMFFVWNRLCRPHVYYELEPIAGLQCSFYFHKAQSERDAASAHTRTT